MKIKKINVSLKELNYAQLKNLSKFIKPSNFKNFLNNKVKRINLISEIDLFIDKDGELEDYIIKGEVTDLKTVLFKDLILSKTDLSFFADKEDILIKNIFGNIDSIDINNGDIKVNLEEGIKINSNFISNINLDSNNIKNFNDLLEEFEITRNIKELNGNFNNDIVVNIDKTYKVTNYNYKLSGKVKNGKIGLFENIKNNFIIKDVKEIFFSDTLIEFDISKKNFKLDTIGKYSFNNSDFFQLELESSFKSDLLKIDTNFEYKKKFNLDLINYKKSTDNVAKISIELEKNKNLLNIKKFSFNEKNEFINISNLKFKDNNFNL